MRLPITRMRRVKCPATVGSPDLGRSVNSSIAFTAGSIWLRPRYQQTSWHHEQVRQRTGYLQSVQVLRQPATSDLGELEQPLDDPEGVLNRGANLGLDPVLGPLNLIDPTSEAILLVDKISTPWGALADQFAVSAVGLIAPH